MRVAYLYYLRMRAYVNKVNILVTERWCATGGQNTETDIRDDVCTCIVCMSLRMSKYIRRQLISNDYECRGSRRNTSIVGTKTYCYLLLFGRTSVCGV